MANWTEQGAGWELRNGDCIEELGTLDESSVDLSVYSPPFSSLYTYSASDRDIWIDRGQPNCRCGELIRAFAEEPVIAPQQEETND